MPDRIIRTIDGKRGGFIVLTSVMLAIVGYSYILYSSAERQAAFEQLLFLSPTVMGAIFLTGALICLPIGIFSGKLPMWCESWAFILLSAATALVASANLVAWILGVSKTGWVSATIYAFFAFTIVHVSSWDNPRRTNITKEIDVPPKEES